MVIRHKTGRGLECRTASSGGFTLMEMAIVVGIIGVILGAVWYAAANAHETQRDNDAVSELQNVAQNISTLMDGQTFPTTTSPPVFYTANMINAQAIPTTYVNAKATSTADNPWNSGAAGGYTGFEVGVPTGKTFRLSFYNVSYQGCLALLLNGTSCQYGQTACPIQVYTGIAGTGLTDTATTGPGWTIMTVSEAQRLCGANSYSGGANSVEFDYSL